MNDSKSVFARKKRDAEILFNFAFQIDLRLKTNNRFLLDRWYGHVNMTALRSAVYFALKIKPTVTLFSELSDWSRRLLSLTFDLINSLVE